MGMSIIIDRRKVLASALMLFVLSNKRSTGLAFKSIQNFAAVRASAQGRIYRSTVFGGGTTQNWRLMATNNGGGDDDHYQEEDTFHPKQQQQQVKTTVPTTNKPNVRKVHHVTVAMIPPPHNAQHLWEVVSQMRRDMKDPGYYRWPPHANLIYPFLDISPKEDDYAKVDEILEQLHSATRQIEPFEVRLQKLGTFGGKKRGVLWLQPDSYCILNDDDDYGGDVDENDDDDKGNNAASTAPLLALHNKLEEAFPMCKDQTKGGSYTPHMTISHFIDLNDALTAKGTIEKDYQHEMMLLGEGKQTTTTTNLFFTVDRIYLMHRKGDEGQFLRMAEIGLGSTSQIEKFRPPVAFDEMPSNEEEWVYEERMKLKARRNGGRGRGGRRKQQRRRSSRSRGPRIPDTPEVIAAKRAERKAKRERLAAEEQQQQKQQQQYEEKGGKQQ